MIIAFVMTVTMYFLLVETRGSKILEDRARRLTAQTGVLHIADTESGGALPGQQGVGILDLLRTTASRPIVFLVTEPVVAALATWAALLCVSPPSSLFAYLLTLLLFCLAQMGRRIHPLLRRPPYLRTVRLLLRADGHHLRHRHRRRLLRRFPRTLAGQAICARREEDGAGAGAA